MSPSPIPAFPDFAAIELGHKEAVEEALRAMARPIAEWTFTNLFLFRNAHGYRVSRFGEMLFLLGKGYDGVAYAFPPWGKGEVEAGAKLLCDHLEGAENAPPLLFPVPAAMVEAHFSSPAWRAEADRDQADYVYRVEDLATLPGKKYHKRKNRLEKFLRETPGEIRYEPLGDPHAEACEALALGWCDERCSTERPSTYRETEAAVEAVRFRSELGLTGAVVLCDGEVSAFCLGEPLGPDTFVVHFEKARPGMEGLAQLINRDFCARGLSGYSFVNREQDLGDEGLRQAKMSYHPDHLAEKFRVIPAPRGGSR